MGIVPTWCTLIHPATFMKVLRIPFGSLFRHTVVQPFSVQCSTQNKIRDSKDEQLTYNGPCRRNHTVFRRENHSRSEKPHPASSHDIHAGRITCWNQVDVLLYMALGNTLGSHLLALGRLAPVQVSHCLPPYYGTIILCICSVSHPIFNYYIVRRRVTPRCVSA